MIPTGDGSCQMLVSVSPVLCFATLRARVVPVLCCAVPCVVLCREVTLRGVTWTELKWTLTHYALLCTFPCALCTFPVQALRTSTSAIHPAVSTVPHLHLRPTAHGVAGPHKRARPDPCQLLPSCEAAVVCENPLVGHFCVTFMLKMIILPRQARDKHAKNSKRKPSCVVRWWWWGCKSPELGAARCGAE